MLVGADLRRSVAAAIVAALTSMLAFVAVPSTVSATGFTCSSDGPTYTVRAGDGWFTIANRAGVSARSLTEANGAALDDVLVPGDRLCLPAGAEPTASCANSYTVRPGDGWFPIASRLGVSVSALLAVNGAGLGRTVHPGDVICAPHGARQLAPSSAPGGGTYTVVRGDSWFGIAARADVSPRSLIAANGATLDDVILPGEVIRLPAGATQPSTRSAAQRWWIDLDALPVQGPCWYGDTWNDARSGGRRHTGTDLFTKPGDYVYAVVDGRLTRRLWDQPGQISGNAWRLTAADGTFFFYAHLAGFAPGLGVGSRVQAGQIIGWVGDTGNANGSHLHFQVHPDGGEPINPYPILRAEGGCNRGTPYTQPGGWVPDLIG
jgi:murein DD-endopeptidase MepM/ murein hydrolase activator NlpD